MQISLLPQIINITNTNKNSVKNINSYPNLTPLKNDTVSFSGYSIKERVSENYEEEIKSEEFKKDATDYLKAINTTVTKLNKKGFSWNREESAKHITKEIDSYISKIIRSGSFVVPDKIRTTIYCNDLRNLSKLVDDLLPTMEASGYVLAPTKMSVKDLMKRGYIPTEKEKSHTNTLKNIKDLDIRLNDIIDQLSILPEDLRYCIGKAQSSGYEDIQMRFVKKSDIGKRNPRTFELLVLGGPAMAEAKHDESEFVYGNTRKFKQIAGKISKNPTSLNEQKVLTYIDLIKNIFETNVSKKLFANAKNKDAQTGIEETPIYFSQKDSQLVNNYFDMIRKLLANIHKSNLDKIKDDPVATKELIKSYRSDRTLLTEIQKSLKATIEHYNILSELSED